MNTLQEEATNAFESATWFRDEFGLLGKAKKNDNVAPEAIFNLNRPESQKSIHDQHQCRKEIKANQIAPSTPPCHSNAKGKEQLLEVDDSFSDNKDTSQDSAFKW
jgi:hypothetical protein